MKKKRHLRSTLGYGVYAGVPKDSAPSPIPPPITPLVPAGKHFDFIALEVFRRSIEDGLAPEYAKLAGKHRLKAARALARDMFADQLVRANESRRKVLFDGGEYEVLANEAKGLEELKRINDDYWRSIEIEAHVRISAGEKARTAGDFPADPLKQREWRVRRLHHKLLRKAEIERERAVTRAQHAEAERQRAEVAASPKPPRPLWDTTQRVLEYVAGGYHSNRRRPDYLQHGAEELRERAAEWMRDGRIDGRRDESGVGVLREDVAIAFTDLEARCKRIGVNFETIRRAIFAQWGGGAASLDDLTPAHYGEVIVSASDAMHVVPWSLEHDGIEGSSDLDNDWHWLAERAEDRPKSKSAFLRFVKAHQACLAFDAIWGDGATDIYDHEELTERAEAYLNALSGNKLAA